MISLGSSGGVLTPAALVLGRSPSLESAPVAGGGGSPTDMLNSAIGDSRAQAAAAVGSSRSGVQAILDQSGVVNDAIGRMNNAADAMLPLADDLSGYGNAMWESGTKVTEQALEALGTGIGFIRMDESSSPLVAEAKRLYGEFDPDRYVAGAAQDVQAQGDNARAQGVRNLSRMGVSPTSGAALALSNIYNKGLAVARAAAMTRARERGKADQMNAFQSLIANNANTFLQTGGQLASIGSSAQAKAADAKKGAASVLGESGELSGRAGSLGLDYGKTLSSAWNALAGTQLNEAKNTNDAEAVRVSAINRGSARGGGSVVVTPAEDDNWMNWKNTGHSESWNRNHNPDFLDLMVNGAPSNPNPAG